MARIPETEIERLKLKEKLKGKKLKGTLPFSEADNFFSSSINKKPPTSGLPEASGFFFSR
jgi:hypothetical protein